MPVHLLQHLSKLEGHRVLCIGDIMLDRFVYGKVERISPEAPIPVIHVQRETSTMGGCGNVVRNLVTLGGHVDVVGVIGHDQAGYDLSGQFSAMPQVVSYIITDEARPTTIKTRYIDGSHQLLRADIEVNGAISPQVEEQVILRIRSAIASCDVVILSDYAKGVLTPTVIKETIRMANEHGKIIMVDPKGRDFSKYRGATYLTPNRKELSEATGISIKTIEDAEKAARKLIKDHDLGGIMAKLGADGVCLILKNDEPAHHYRHNAREIYDVSGAGDTVVAAAALALAGGLSPQDATTLSSVSGSIVVGKVGTATICVDDIVKELNNNVSLLYEQKIVGTDRAVEIAEKWHKQGMKVGFTNGIFDLLHMGHLSLIRQARERCDRLIVGLNKDSSVKKIKGEDRPIFNETARASILASLTDVDLIVLFGEDTPIDLIKDIHPDLLVKGSNYAFEEVIGGELVKGWGGEVFLAPVVDGQSTSSTIDKLQKKNG